MTSRASTKCSWGGGSGAGLRLGPDELIRGAIQRVLDEPSFRDGARRLGATIAAENGARTAADELESLVGKIPA